MALQVTPIHDAILARVKATLPFTPIFEDTVPDEVSIPSDTNLEFKPYGILRFGPLRPSYGGGWAVAGPRHDDYNSTVDVMAVAPTGRMARQLHDVMMDCLIGFAPGGGGTITSEGSGSNFVVSSNEVRPTQMVAMARLKFPVNGTSVGEAMAPPIP
jgi:hypothetical protein